MTIIKLRCKHCSSIAEEVRKVRSGNYVLSFLKCGHTFARYVQDTNKIEIISTDGKMPVPAQERAYDFAVASEFRCMLRMAPRTGKTVVTEMLFKRHPDVLFPALIVCKSRLTVNFFREFFRWSGGEHVAQVLESGKDIPFPSFKIYACSFNLLKKMLPKFKAQGINIKCIVADEVQHLKNRDADRTEALFELRAMFPDAKRIATSGTPITRHAPEYFTILNWLYPERFNNYDGYVRSFVDTIWDGRKHRLGGISKAAYPRFKQLTQDFILNMEKDEVNPDFPKVNRQLETVQMDKLVQEAYQQNLEAFCKEYEYTQKIAPGTNLLGILQRMRHLAGVAKVKPITEWVAEFLYDTDRKIVIFTEHRDVAKLLFNGLENICKASDMPAPLALPSGLGSEEALDLLKKFEKSHRVVIASTKANNEGMNMSFCDAFIMAERQWTPIPELQAEERFLGLEAIEMGTRSVDGIYFVAMNSIDEFQSQLAAIRWQAVNQTLTGNFSASSQWSEESVMKQLADKIFESGRKGIYRPI